VVWCGVVCDVVSCDVMWCDVVWCGVFRYSMFMGGDVRPDPRTGACMAVASDGDLYVAMGFGRKAATDPVGWRALHVRTDMYGLQRECGVGDDFQINTRVYVYNMCVCVWCVYVWCVYVWCVCVCVCCVLCVLCCVLCVCVCCVQLVNVCLCVTYWSGRRAQ